MQNVIFTENTCFLWQNHVLNVFLRWIQYYKHCLPMKSPSNRDFSLFSYLGNLGPLEWRNMHIRLLEENFEKIREFHWRNLFITYSNDSKNVVCTDSSTFGQSFPLKIQSWFFTVFILRRLRPIGVKKHAYTIVGGKFRENNSENSFIEETVFVLNVFLRWIQYYKHCLHSIQSWFFTVFILRQLRPIAVKKHAYTIWRKISRK